jgi:hypothetical protein
LPWVIRLAIIKYYPGNTTISPSPSYSSPTSGEE